MTKTLRELCQAVVDTWPLWAANDRAYQPFFDAEFALLSALSCYDSVDVDAVDMARAILAGLDAEREAGRAEERDRLMARVHEIGSDAIKSYRRLGTQRAEGGMDALLTAADILGGMPIGTSGRDQRPKSGSGE